MNIQLCTLCLNELEWLPLLYEQHKNWPGLRNWTFVESADVLFAETNPDRVSKDGLSVDGTSEFLADLAKRDRRVTYIPHGFCRSADKEQAKCEARQRYLDVADEIAPDLCIVVDADEFYTHRHQRAVNLLCQRLPSYRAYLFPQRHLWRPPSLSEAGVSVMDKEVVGGYWAVPHYRVWRWAMGLRYEENHNWPQDRKGRFLTRQGLRLDDHPRRSARYFTRMRLDVPECVHTGFASSRISRTAKHSYYVARGEGTGDSRQMYVDCRKAFEEWTPDSPTLPHGARVIPYTGPVPEVFRECPPRPDELLPTPEHAEGHSGVA